MNELMIFMAGAMPEELLIEEMANALSEYINDHSDENRKKVVALCSLFTTKEILRAQKGGAVGLMKEMQDIKKMMDLADIKPH